MFCHQCGEEVQENDSYCPHCGADLSTSKKSIKTSLFTLGNKQVTWILICCLWIAILLIGRAADDDEGTFYAIVFGIPIVSSLIILLTKNIKETKKQRSRSLTVTPLSEFMKQYDCVRLDKIASIYTGEIKHIMVFSKELRVSFDETFNDEISSEDIQKNLGIIKVRSIGENKYIISKS